MYTGRPQQNYFGSLMFWYVPNRIIGPVLLRKTHPDLDPALLFSGFQDVKKVYDFLYCFCSHTVGTVRYIYIKIASYLKIRTF
jgi:hypothetical protein